MTFTLQKSLKLQIPPKEIETSYCVNFKPHTCVSPKIGGEGIMEKHQALVAPLADLARPPLSILLYIVTHLLMLQFVAQT